MTSSWDFVPWCYLALLPNRHSSNSGSCRDDQSAYVGAATGPFVTCCCCHALVFDCFMCLCLLTWISWNRFYQHLHFKIAMPYMSGGVVAAFSLANHCCHTCWGCYRQGTAFCFTWVATTRLFFKIIVLKHARSASWCPSPWCWALPFLFCPRPVKFLSDLFLPFWKMVCFCTPLATSLRSTVRQRSACAGSLLVKTIKAEAFATRIQLHSRLVHWGVTSTWNYWCVWERKNKSFEMCACYFSTCQAVAKG